MQSTAACRQGIQENTCVAQGCIYAAVNAALVSVMGVAVCRMTMTPAFGISAMLVAALYSVSSATQLVVVITTSTQSKLGLCTSVVKFIPAAAHVQQRVCARSEVSCVVRNAPSLVKGAPLSMTTLHNRLARRKCTACLM